MREWLIESGVTIAAMESTSTYWKPPFYCLEDVMDVWLLNAAHMKAVPGRKTDVRDAEWIAQLLECGLLRAERTVFIPDQLLAILSDHIAAHVPPTKLTAGFSPTAWSRGTTTAAPGSGVLPDEKRTQLTFASTTFDTSTRPD
jgi:hypothetical protein